jgi:hypothetical protein
MAIVPLILRQTEPLIFVRSGVSYSGAVIPLIIDEEMEVPIPLRVLLVTPINSNTLRVYFTVQPAFRGVASPVSIDNPSNYEVVDDQGLISAVGVVENGQAQPDASVDWPDAYSVDLRLNRQLLWDRTYTVTLAPTLLNRYETTTLSPAPFNSAQCPGIHKALNPARTTTPHTARR